MTDLMVSKLATVHLACREGFLNEDPHRLYRDEIQVVVVDTVLLLESEDPSATLEQWRSAA